MDKWFGTTLGRIRGESKADFEERVVGVLSAALSFRSIQSEQQVAWRVSAGWVWDWARDANACPDNWLVLFEYATPLVTSRPDVVVVTGRAVLILEFKTGKTTPASAKRQVLEYAHDLYWFHPGTRGRSLEAIVVATNPSLTPPHTVATPDVLPTEASSYSVQEMVDLLQSIGWSEEDSYEAPSPDLWLNAQYRPRPSIIDAAVALFAQNDDPGISAAVANDDELEALTEFLVRAVHRAAHMSEHRVILVNGVPGAGKTLVGLRLAFDKSVIETLREIDSNPLYLTGNGPLVKVLTEALARDFVRRQQTTNLSAARREAGTLVKLVHSFTRESLSGQSRLDVPHVTVFDEGQRVWNAHQMASKHKFSGENALTEPEVILSNLEQQAWAVVVVLVGDGQEINTGESGVDLWTDAVRERSRNCNPQWLLSCSMEAKNDVDYREVTPVLSLGHSRRSEEAAWLPSWVEAVIDGDWQGARRVFRDGSYPLFLTRDLETARCWLRSADERARYGLVASAHAARLRPYGIEMNTEFQAGIRWENWFLDRPPSLESSTALEVAASEFKCQGLELDFVGVCWSWDLIRSEGEWVVRSLRGRDLKWKSVTGDKHRFGLNAYRVLLTRARAGMIIWIPIGDVCDPTRTPGEMDEIYEFLTRCGVPTLPWSTAPLGTPVDQVN